MFSADNIINLPYDIHELISHQINKGTDIYNYKNTCKTFKNFADLNPTVQVELFKFRLKITFPNCDINKHSTICKKFSEIIKQFKLYKIHYDRTHDSRRTIFDTQTLVYFDIFIDNVSEFKNKFSNLLKLYNLTNYNVDYSITIYFNDEFPNLVINCMEKNINNDIIISNESKYKISNINLFYIQLNIYSDFTKIEEFIDSKYIFNISLNNSKLYFTKYELIIFLNKILSKEKKIIQCTMGIIDTSNNLKNISDAELLLQSTLNKIKKYNNYLKNISLLMNKNKSVIRCLEPEFILIE